jgi:methyl coenzyme M reductase subunit D
MLINSLLAHANDAHWEEFISELERLNVRKAVVVCGTSLPEEISYHSFLGIDVCTHH